jgi:signal transduction histidine kinase
MMSLKTKILLPTGVLMLGLVGGLSALLLSNLVVSNLQSSLRLAELAAQQTKGLLLIRLEESGKTGAADRLLWFSAIAADTRLATFLANSVAQAPSLIEISIAGDDNRILVSSTRSNSGFPLRGYQSLHALLALDPFNRIRRVFARGPDYEVRIPIGILNDPRPIFTIQVLVSTVLLRDSLHPGLQWIGFAALTALFVSLLFVSLLASFISRNLRRISEGIDLIRHGEAVPELNLHASAPEFAAVQSQLSRLGGQVRDTARTAVDFRSRVSTVLERLEEGILLFDPEQRLILSSGASERLLGRPLVGFQVSATPLGPILRDAFDQHRSMPERLIEWPSADGSAPLLVALDFFADGRALIRLRDPEGRRQIESQMGLLSRLDAINRLTRGVAHEVKNPLNSIAARLALLESMVGEDSPEAAEEIKVIGEEVERLDRVVCTFLDFTRPVEMAREQLDLAKIARDVADLVQPDAARRSVAVHFRSKPECVPLWGDPDLLRQALLNLAVNALDAMPQGGSLSFDVKLRTQDARLTVADTGVGIPETQREKIFQLYFTTKQNGSGLGLAMVYRAVQLHGGSIEVESEPGRGTRFRITLPALVKL